MLQLMIPARLKSRPAVPEVSLKLTAQPDLMDATWHLWAIVQPVDVA
jgi:hypothetical protein